MTEVELVARPPAAFEYGLQRLERFVSPLVGVVRRVAETLAAPDELRLPSIGCELADGVPVIGAELESYTGCSHPDPRAARAAAIGEAIERYAASFVPEDRLVFSTARELGEEAPAPNRFALFSDEQYRSARFPFRRFTDDTSVAWAPGFAVDDGRPVKLPAQLVYMAWKSLRRGESRVAYATSSGLACGATLEEATLVALLELVERDAFMLAWANRLSLPLLDWRDHPGLRRLDDRFFAVSRLPYSAVDLSAFLDVPTVLGVVHGPPGQLGALGVGAGSAATVEEAWRKALSEAFSVQRWVRDRALEDPELLDAEADSVTTFDDHTLFYARAERAALAAFLDAADDARPVADVRRLEGETARDLIAAVTERLARRGITAYAADVTTPDVAAAGLRVVRAVAPELCPLDVVHRARFLGGDRLYRAAHEAGLTQRPLQPTDVNPWPHPFP